MFTCAARCSLVLPNLQEQLVKSPDATMRSTCAATLLQFLLDWPLQDHRLTQHLEFVLSNLSFELEDGRLQARAVYNMTSFTTFVSSTCFLRVSDLFNRVLLMIV